MPAQLEGSKESQAIGAVRRAPLTSSEPWAGCFDRQASLGVWRPLGTCAGEVLTFDSDAGRRRGYGRDSISVATASVSRLDWRRRAGPRALVLVAVGVAGIVATALTAWAVANSPILVHAKSVWIWRALIVAAYVAVGLYRWWRRPDSRFGQLVVGNGFLYAATAFNASGASPAYTLGMVFWAVYVVYTGYLLLSYPGGRLRSRLERAFIRAYALSTAVLWGLILALSPSFPASGTYNDCGTRCPPNALGGGDAVIGKALDTAASIVFTIALIGLMMLLVDKARAPGPVLRRTLTPVTAVFTAVLLQFVISLYVLPAYPETASVVTIVNGVIGLAVPMAILLGLAWEDLYVARSVGQIAVRAGGKPLTAAGVQTVIGEALGDSTTALALWAPERAGYVDVDGAPLELPRDPRVRGVTPITDANGPVAALIHDPTIDIDSDALEGLAATSLMLVENIRLLDELRASRLRIVDTADHERRRLERDLHDGAQQRLMAVQIKLRMLEDSTEAERIAGQLEAISNDAEAAVEELRSLAHGIYPPVLRSDGLVNALRSVAMTAPIAISVTDAGIGRCSPSVEAAIYFCSAEAIQNAIKHAGSNVRVRVTIGRDRDRVHFAITDDGAGIDRSERGDGVGLIGMRDRVGAVGGELEIVASPGRGTTVRGTIPDAVTPRADDAPPPSNPEASTPPHTHPRSGTGG